MSDKYIIKNCPAYYINTCSDSKVKEQYCSKCTDCVMKQIVDKCKFWIDAEKNNRYKTNGWILSDDILRSLGIQEVK